ncbi:MAG: DUF2799 domain-containing protein [Gammaproteobacteria bacterium]|nr:DUF2799 domain-containing protein [Gammaproteobacteria bacterium]NVK89366.1 DUF2799 domain-containing protein [Gammaproteobacteria bacterium]
MRYLLFFCTIALLSGCNQWVIPQATTSNWYNIGKQEGQAGISPNWRNNYHVVRGGASEDFDAQQYQKGYQEGRKLYCANGRCALSRRELSANND